MPCCLVCLPTWPIHQIVSMPQHSFNSHLIGITAVRGVCICAHSLRSQQSNPFDIWRYVFLCFARTDRLLMACKKMSRPFKVDDNNNYAFNLLAAGEIMPAFMAKKDHKYVDPIRAEWYKNGNYMSWDDVEKRVPGFKRQMLTKRNKCSFSFVRFSLSMRCMAGMESQNTNQWTSMWY